jgi:elongation factor G
MERGVRAGFPLMGVGAALYDGSFHEVDSSEIAFKVAGSMALQDAARRARPAILEPVMEVEAVTPEEYLGDVIGDLNRRRGRVLGMENRAGYQVATVYVPLSEMFGYATDLRSQSQGRATYTMQFDHYNPVPQQVADQIVARATGMTA